MVIAIIAILFAVVLVAINPAQRFKDSRNSRRLADVKSIVEAATTYTADRRGAQLPDVPDYQCVGTKSADDFSTIPTGSTAVWKFDNSLNDTVPVDNSLASNFTSYTTNSSGKFGEAIQMNGSTSSLSASDHAELDPVSSALALDGWIKLNQKIEPGAFDHHQAFFDKGNYRLQINSDSGRLEFEIQNGSVWSPDYDTSSTNIKGINTFTQFQGSLYAGGIKTPSDQAVLLKKNGGTWSIVSSYPATDPSITALIVYNGKMYSGQMGGRVYAFDGLSWISTNLETLTGSADVLSLTRYKGKLYAGLGSAVGASVWSYDGTSWSISKQFDQTTQAVAVYALTVYNGKLYAGTGRGALNQEARLFEYDGNTWTQRFVLAKDGAYSLMEYNKELYIGFGGGDSATDGVIYKGDGVTFSPVGFASQYYVYSLGVFNGVLFAGEGGLAGGSGDVYYWDGTVWTLNLDNASTIEIRSFYPYKGKLYAGGRGANDTQSGIWTYGNNGFLESQKTKWLPNAWYHIASVYNGTSSVMNLMINGYLMRQQALAYLELFRLIRKSCILDQDTAVIHFPAF